GIPAPLLWLGSGDHGADGESTRGDCRMPGCGGRARGDPVRPDHRALPGPEEARRSCHPAASAKQAGGQEQGIAMIRAGAPGCNAGRITEKELLMNPFQVTWGTFLVFGLVLSANAGQPAKPALLESANGLFREGKFAEAESLYSKIQAEDQGSFEAALRLGTIALFKNKLTDAEMAL